MHLKKSCEESAACPLAYSNFNNFNPGTTHSKAGDEHLIKSPQLQMDMVHLPASSFPAYEELFQSSLILSNFQTVFKLEEGKTTFRHRPELGR